MADDDRPGKGMQLTDTNEGEQDQTSQSADNSGAKLCERLRDILHINRPLIPVKVLYFAIYGGLITIHVYMSVFLKQLGLSPQQIGLISGLKPLLGAVSGPIWGMFGDKYDIRKCLLLFSLSAWIAFYVGLYCIPAPNRSSVCPSNTTINTRVLTIEAKLKKTLSILRTRDHVITQEYTNKSDNVSTYTADEIHRLCANIGWLYDPGGLRVVFIVCLILVVGSELVVSPTTGMADVGTFQTLGREGVGRFGAQRAWGPVGAAVCTFTAGLAASRSLSPETICGITLYFSDYKRVAYVFIAVMIPGFICATQLKFTDNQDPERVELTSPSEAGHGARKDFGQKHNTVAVLKFFWNIHHLSMLATFVFIGACEGVGWGFLYWHLENLGADQLMMGVDGWVQQMSNFIFCLLANRLVQFTGHIGIIYLGLIVTIIRFIVYAVVTNPWWVLTVDWMDGIPFSCVCVSMLSYITISVPDVSLATALGILHGTYTGLGLGLGHLLGGLLIGYFGALSTFLSVAGFSVLVLVLFIVCQKCSQKPKFHDFGYKESGRGALQAEDE